MKNFFISLLFFVTPIIIFSQTIKNVTTTKVLAFISQEGELQKTKEFKQLNYFKISQNEIKFYKGGKVENELTFDIITASIEKINGGIKLSTTRYFMGSKEIFIFMLFDEDIIIMSYLGSFYIYHNLTENGIDQFFENNL